MCQLLSHSKQFGSCIFITITMDIFWRPLAPSKYHPQSCITHKNLNKQSACSADWGQRLVFLLNQVVTTSYFQREILKPSLVISLIVMVHFMCQLDKATGRPYIWLNIIFWVHLCGCVGWDQIWIRLSGVPSPVWVSLIQYKEALNRTKSLSKR